MTKIAAQMNTVRASCQEEDQLLDTLTRLKELGFDGVELEFSLLKHADRDRLAAHMAGLGLEAASIRSPFSRTEFGLEDMIAQAKTLKCQNVGIGTMTIAHFNSGPSALEAYFEKLQAVCRRFEAEGLRPLYSLRNHEFIRQPGGRWFFDELTDRAEGLAFETDVLALTRAAVEPNRIFARLRGRMPVCRLTDQKLRACEMYFFFPEREECPLGEGLFDLPLWTGAALEAGTQWLVLGQDLCDRDPFRCLERSLRTARELLR